MKTTSKSDKCIRKCIRVLLLAVALAVLSANYHEFASIKAGYYLSDPRVSALKRLQTDIRDEPKHQHDFTYDREGWEKNSPRIVVLAGPHKTASTTLQTFFSNIAGTTVPLTDEEIESKIHEPLPDVTDWAWPIGVRDDYESEGSVGGGFHHMQKPAKFYAILASLISGRRRVERFPYLSDKSESQQQEGFAKASDYFRSLFRIPWDEQKNLVIAAEAFDTLVEDLAREVDKSDHGEDTHVAPHSGEMIDALLDVFPWDDSTTSSSASNGDSRTPPLRLEDIEVHINYRTPRIKHALSIWHQLGHGRTFRFFLNSIQRHTLYQINSLALALQFVKRGIKTTIVDMSGVFEKESKDPTEKTTGYDRNTAVGGLQGVVACEILRMGKNNALCDDHNRLHLSGYVPQVEDMNNKGDVNLHNLTPEQMEEINTALEQYDCGVWQHLKKYQDQGIFRILYPTENLFGTCDLQGSRDISFKETLQKINEISNRENGIPIQTEEEFQKMKEERHKAIDATKGERRKERIRKDREEKAKREFFDIMEVIVDRNNEISVLSDEEYQKFMEDKRKEFDSMTNRERKKMRQRVEKEREMRVAE